MNILCLIESINLRHNPDELHGDFIWNESTIFVIAFIYQIIFFFIVLFLILTYLVIWKPSYNIKSGIDWLLDPF